MTDPDSWVSGANQRGTRFLKPSHQLPPSSPSFHASLPRSFRTPPPLDVRSSWSAEADPEHDTRTRRMYNQLKSLSASSVNLIKRKKSATVPSSPKANMKDAQDSKSGGVYDENGVWLGLARYFPQPQYVRVSPPFVSCGNLADTCVRQQSPTSPTSPTSSTSSSPLSSPTPSTDHGPNPAGYI